MSRSKSTRPSLTPRNVAAHTDPGYIWFDSPRRLGHRVSQKGATSFVLLWQPPNGKQTPRRIAAGDTPIEEVRRLTLEKLALIARGETPFPEETESPLLTSVMEDHIRFLETQGNQRHGRKLTPPLARAARKNADRWLKAQGFDRLRADQLTKDNAGKWLGQLRTKSGPVAAERARSMLVAGLRLKGLSVAAFEHRETKARGGRARKRVLAPDELRQLRSALEAAPLRHRVFYTVLLRTGLRKTELASARRSDINLARGTLKVRAERRGKSNSNVTVQLDAKCIALFEELWREFPPMHDWAFPSLKKAGAHVSNIYEWWEDICKVAGIPDVRPHDLRRTFGTYAALGSLSAEQISAALGNTSNVAARHYIQLANDQRTIARVQNVATAQIDAALAAADAEP